MSESKIVGKRGTWCVLVSSLNSQVNNRNHFCARHINTFWKPSQWFIPWRTCWWQLSCCSVTVTERGISSSDDLWGYFPTLLTGEVGLHQLLPMHSCQSTHLPACEGDGHSGKQTCRTQLQFQPLGILNTWWLEILQIFCPFCQSETLNNECDEWWNLKQGYAFDPDIFP